jgi:non-ribosomal peptide synthetase component F
MAYLVCAPLTIDAAVAGLYFAFAAGGRVVLPTDEQAQDPMLLAELIAREAVSHVDGLPSHYAALLDYHAGALRDVRCVILGGEALPSRLARKHLAEAPHADLHNEYGPTEATVWSTTHPCSAQDDGASVPIGRPIAETRVAVLTGELRPAPAGTVGEIYISGPGLARGYLGRAGLTAERFLPDPDPRNPGGRMYRTGDLGHTGPDGQLYFHGRTDHLIKVRGYRVEAQEVEAHLTEHPDVAAAAVVPNDTASGVRLVAIVAAEPGRSPRSGTLAAFLADRLPAYMIPTVWRRTEALPVAANGKVDRTSLTREATTTGTELPR